MFTSFSFNLVCDISALVLLLTTKNEVSKKKLFQQKKLSVRDKNLLYHKHSKNILSHTFLI